LDDSAEGRDSRIKRVNSRGWQFNQINMLYLNTQLKLLN